MTLFSYYLSFHFMIIFIWYLLTFSYLEYFRSLIVISIFCHLHSLITLIHCCYDSDGNHKIFCLSIKFSFLLIFIFFLYP
jgi:hypothetical protein